MEKTAKFVYNEVNAASKAGSAYRKVCTAFDGRTGCRGEGAVDRKSAQREVDVAFGGNTACLDVDMTLSETTSSRLCSAGRAVA